MTTKLYQCAASAGNQVRLQCITASSREYALGWAHSEFQKAEGFAPRTVSAAEVNNASIRKAMPAVLSEKIEVGFRSTGATLVDDTIVFHVVYKSDDPASIAHKMAEIEEECSEQEFVAALQVVMSNCAFLKNMKNNSPDESK